MQHVPATTLTAVDYLVMALYFGVVLGIGFALRRRTNTASEFLQSGRSLPPWVTGLAFLSANDAFDYDGNGQVDSNDLLQFRLNFLAQIV